LNIGSLSQPACTNIGNPHATFFVDNVETVDLAALGPVLEHDRCFPNAPIWRCCGPRPFPYPAARLGAGAGITPACGSGACAALVAANRRGLTDAAPQSSSMAQRSTSPGARTAM